MKAMLKKGLYLTVFSALVGLMASCLGSNDEVEIFPLSDAELLEFWLYHDSLPELRKTSFTIDHRSLVGAIYNYDSMAFMTNLPEKVLIGYLSGSGTDNVLNITNGDSIWLKQGDSIDISTPQTLKVFALNGVTTKLYVAQLNIHQIDPDSLQYHRIASSLPFLQTEDTKTITFNNLFLTYSKIDDKIQLYSSQDAVNWEYESLSGLPDNAVVKEIQSNGTQIFAYTEDGELYVRYDSAVDDWNIVNKPSSIKIRSILGYMNAGPKQSEGLCLVVETEGEYIYAFTNFVQWDFNNTTPIPDDFPLNNFSTHSHQIMLTERITIFGGTSSNGTVRNAVWSTENGLYWAKLTGNVNVFPPFRGANVFYYNQEFWLINGKDGDNYNDEIYFSKDGGVTWNIKSEKCDFPDDYILRYNASLVMDKDNKYYYIIGGKHDNVLPDVWKGFLNKVNFER